MRLANQARQAALSADAVAVYTVLVRAPLTGRVRHATVQGATGFNRLRYALALGALESRGCLPSLVTSPLDAFYTACDRSRCEACDMGAAQ